MVYAAVVIIFCADVEEISESLHCLLTAESSHCAAAGDVDSQKPGDVTLSLSEYTSLTSRLTVAEEALRHTTEQLQHALSDLEKMK